MNSKFSFFSWYHHQYSNWAKRKAHELSAEWRATNELQHKDGHSWLANDDIGLPIERSFRQYDIERELTRRSFPHPYWFLMLPRRLDWWLRNHGPTAQKNNLKFFIERGRKGFSYKDTWGLDSYLSSVIGDSVEELNRYTHGYPSGLTEESWKRILDDIVIGMRAAQTLDDIMYTSHCTEDLDSLQEAFEYAMDLLKQNWFSLWD